MHTTQLIDTLARGLEPVDPRLPRRALAVALGLGCAGAVALMLPLLGLHPALQEALADPMFWVRWGFTLALLAASVAAARRLGRPGMAAGHIAGWAAAPVALLWLLAAGVLWQAPADERVALVLGTTWRVCAFNIALLSVPALVAGMLAMRTMAPTRPAAAGAAVGAAAGALGAAVYAWHCPELAAPFIAVWYVAGIVLSSVIGALAGRVVLRW
ncbi:NrsF family protein [Caldimonas brevitalea]|uniref:DUF1109 domain-containing protein n=1 Tax=Caldimonas brevitalea TaxID=413882 RepID=A0A0G3BUJ9_9BURK|nr:DUF1109 domain-containing protein [Caldimonas brevitalea]AKJ30210.1 hypothetical protein AAW51_3519 [Caldimonas brevitalea]